ncbi:hypothetical protein ABZV93_11990 [Actinopolymorpha sp. NPDC004070]|uniref:hypothetical protein n=1 Tax=Actinopolymorpha sp. NPDC004070 TaxID=3154548 RepID=UPI0033AC7921
MDQPRRRVPHSVWIALAVATAVSGWFLLLGGDVVRTSREPDESSREYVADQRDQAEGVPMVLPVTLPSGYDSASDYGYIDLNAHDEPGEPDDTPAHVDAREVRFMPTEGVQARGGLPAVQLCVEYAGPKPEVACHASPHAIKRRHGRAIVTFYAASTGGQDLSGWKSVELTTDLDKVTWLH